MVSFTDYFLCPVLTTFKGYVRTMYHNLPSPQQYLDPKDAPADITVERRHLSRGPGFSKEHRIVELHKPRGRRDLSPIEHHRSSRSANPQRREMALAQKGIIPFHQY